MNNFCTPCLIIFVDGEMGYMLKLNDKNEEKKREKNCFEEEIWKEFKDHVFRRFNQQNIKQYNRKNIGKIGVSINSKYGDLSIFLFNNFKLFFC
jgi:DNA-binding IscR family transcriptional regulator